MSIIAVSIKSDLEIPPQISKFLSLYLLFSIGFKGGMELSHIGLTKEVVVTPGLAVALVLIVPLYTYFILRRKLDVSNAGALAATNGSVSAVTFISASSFLADKQIPLGGHMMAAMALMESTAIIIGVTQIRLFSGGEKQQGHKIVSVPVKLSAMVQY